MSPKAVLPELPRSPMPKTPPDVSVETLSSQVRMMMPPLLYQFVACTPGMKVLSQVSPLATALAPHGLPLVCMSSQTLGLNQMYAGGEALFRSVCICEPVKGPLYGTTPSPNLSHKEV